MRIRDTLQHIYFRQLKHSTSPFLKQIAKGVRNAESYRLSLVHGIADVYPNIIKADVRYVFLAITSQCNLRCDGCDYGREFMPKESLDLESIKTILDDLKHYKIPNVWIYGGEPLIHKDLPEIVAYAYRLGLHPTLGSNAVLLKPQKMDSLYEAGLRQIYIGIYGIGEEYDKYVDKKDRFAQLEKNIAYITQTYPDVTIVLSWLLMKPTCNTKSLQEVVDFAKKYSIQIGVQLVHYDFPYFNDGKKEELQLYEEDRPQIYTLVKRMEQIKEESPELIVNSKQSIHAIPDWLIEKQNLEVPCYMYNNIWVAANGDVMVCQKNSLLGNINETKFRDILYTKEHTEAARTSFNLNCSRCHVKFDIRTRQHPKTRRKYESSIIPIKYIENN